jgi:Flp pilus assembly protein CpaB
MGPAPRSGLSQKRSARGSSSAAAILRGRAQPGSRLQRSRRARARRWLTAGLVGLAIAVGLSAIQPAGTTGAGVPTVVAARAIAAGVVISRADVQIEARRAEHRPESAAPDLTAVVGRRSAGPIEAKGVITFERLIGPGLLAGRSDGRVAMTVPVMEVALTGVEPGVRVDVYATGTGNQVVTDAQVLAVHGGGGASAISSTDAEGGEAGEGGGALGSPMSWQDQPAPGITVAVSSSEAHLIAAQLSALSAGESFVLAVRPGR